jgi:hypothetical protein
MTLDELRYKLCEAKYNPVVVIWEQHTNPRDNRVYSTRVNDLYFTCDPFQSVTIDTTPCWARS